ncbi:hypothetical protein A3H80_00795 [Candidatus Roizmanbacteria bacterium RIFCSPLOWO2_02_FULL_37_19]|nr:MAG: hypothetical protein A3H80_00795 [Candidatus Roizmanbacteria bacterium RIFCSPLOWO2_02_FULL_37_19]OGK60384.1 MAG: hypothetical protein A3G65_04690 [Candidatus Roizmanbacteria bacterium RIFCSPLOWO2_12_FULL_37_7b]
MQKFLFITIVLLALILRLYGLNWDQNQHLHPDERFLTMVSNAMKIPESITQYMNPTQSTLNPYNIGFSFFVYGTFPLTLNKLFVVFSNVDTYNETAIYGRALSAIFDVLSLIFVIKMMQLWEQKYKIDNRIKYFAGFLYAIAVVPIQNAHFFTTDSFLVFFALASIYFSLRYFYDKRTIDIALCGTILGLAFASKLSAILPTFLIIVLIVLAMINEKFPILLRRRSGRLKYKPTSKVGYYSNIDSPAIHPMTLVIHIGLFLITFYIALRLADPRLFTNANFFDIHPNPQFIENIKQLNTYSNPNVWFPPGVQWVHKQSIAFPLINLAVFGLGIPYFLIVLIGVRDFLQHRKKEFYVIFLWIIGFFLYQSTQFVMGMRYFYPLYPFFAIIGAFGIVTIIEKVKKYQKLAISILLIFVSIWPLGFMAIYTRPHSRVTASQWIYKNIPAGSHIVTEHWDDALPLPINYDSPLLYKIDQLPVFDPDTPDKWNRIDSLLKQADYYIFSSNRGYGSILTAPERYPQMSKFYKDLFAGRGDFMQVQEFTSYPYFSINDQWSDESFTVYDHPKVTIFKKL